MSESKVAKAVAEGIARSNPKLLAHHLSEIPDLQPALYALVEALVERWTDNFNAGRHYGENDRVVHEKAAKTLSAPPKPKRTTPRKKRSLPSEAVIWDSGSEGSPKCENESPDGHDFENGIHGSAGWSTMEKDINDNLDIINSGGVLGNPFIPGAMWFPQPPGQSHSNPHE